MELTLQANKSNIFIKNYENGCFYIADKVYKHNICILKNQISQWKTANISQLVIKDIEEIIQHRPEIIILGTGITSMIPSKEIIKTCHSKNIGIELMKTESACKTFNLLIAEERDIAAVFFI